MNYNKFNFKSRDDVEKINRIEKMLMRPISLPGEYLVSGKANDGDKVFWLFLNLLSGTYGTSWWKQENMMKITGISESKMKGNIRKLKSAGWLEVTRRFQSNKYKLIWPESCHNPRIIGAKKNSEMDEMKNKLDGRENRRNYRNNKGGFQKAFNGTYPHKA